MDSNKFKKVFEDIFNMFIRAEYIKRNFEYTSDDACWLKENWDMPIKNGIIDTKMPILVMNDFINYIHALENERSYESIITKEYEKKFKFISGNPSVYRKTEAFTAHCIVADNSRANTHRIKFFKKRHYSIDNFSFGIIIIKKFFKLCYGNIKMKTCFHSDIFQNCGKRNIKLNT